MVTTSKGTATAVIANSPGGEVLAHEGSVNPGAMRMIIRDTAWVTEVYHVPIVYLTVFNNLVEEASARWVTSPDGLRRARLAVCVARRTSVGDGRCTVGASYCVVVLP